MGIPLSSLTPAMQERLLGSTRPTPNPQKRSKYGNVPTVTDGIRFASKREAARYNELALARDLGEVLWFLRQVPFHLPGGVKYVADFLVFWKDGTVTVEDVKGRKTDKYVMKKKQVQALYPIVIREL